MLTYSSDRLDKYEAKVKVKKIKVSGLTYKRSKQINTFLSWLMFQNIYAMCQNINNTVARNSDMILISMSYSIKFNKQNEKV